MPRSPHVMKPHRRDAHLSPHGELDGQGETFAHPAFLYRGVDDFLEVMVPYVQAGIDNGEVVLVVANGDHLPSLEQTLDDPGSKAHLFDTFEWYPHPATRLRAFWEFVTVQTAAGARRFRLAGEPVWPSRPELTREWQRYESVLNSVLAGYPASLLCLYDRDGLDPSILDTAHCTHPEVAGPRGTRPSGEYRSPEEFLRVWEHELSAIPQHADPAPDPSDMTAARGFVVSRAVKAGVHPGRAVELGIATNEILTNALMHAEGAEISTWRQNGSFVCHVENLGPPLEDPFAGYLPPGRDGEGGRGLWLVRQLVDLLQIVPGRDRTFFRLHLDV